MTQQITASEAEMGERAFRLDRRQILSIIRDMSESVIVLGPDADIEFVNMATEKLLDFDHLEMAGMPFGAIVADDNLDFFKALREIITKGPITDYRLDYLARGNKRIPVSINGSVLRDGETGRFLGIVVVARDMRDILGLIKKLEEANAGLEERVKERTKELEKANAGLRETQAQLLQKEKMASIGQLAAGVAHEINNPIAFLLSNLGALEASMKDIIDVVRAYECAVALVSLSDIEELKKGLDANFLIKDSLDIIRESMEGARRVKRIVEDLREFSQVDSAGTCSADINKCIDSALCMVSMGFENKPAILKEYGEVPDVFCDPGELSQVLLNILVNAWQAVDGKGEIRIKTYMTDNHVFIEVSDNGCGISPENLPRVFEPFFTTKPVGHTGLGLSIAYGIVEKHKGDVRVMSSIGRGTTISVALPVGHD